MTTMDTGFKLLDNEVIHDDAFVVRKSRMGLYNSFTVTGVPKLCALTEKECVDMTRWHLKCEQEGWPEGSVKVIGNAVVDGKL